MKGEIQRLTMAVLILAASLLLSAKPASAFEESAVLLQFNPEQNYSSRYMFQLGMLGAHVSPGMKDEIAYGEFLIGTVFKDKVVESLFGLNRHRITFYEYNVREAQGFGQDRVDPRFGGNPWPSLPGFGGGGGGGTGGGGGGGNGGGGGGNSGGGGGGGGRGPGGGGGTSSAPTPQSGGFISNLGLPGGGTPMQGPPGGGPGGGGRNPGGGGAGGGGGMAGEPNSAISLDTIRVTNLDYVTNKQGEVLDVGGLDLLRKVSKNRLLQDDTGEKQYIDVNISNIFEWTHLLYLPTYPVYKESLWFHSYPIHVPGLPDDKPIMTKFTYRLIDFRTVGSRKVAVIDMAGVCEWNMEWDDRTKEELTEFKSWGNMGISARYWFDYEHGEIFAIERPPFIDWQYQKFYPGFTVGMPYNPVTGFAMQFPGLVVTMEFFYNTRITDISGKPRLVEVEPKEKRRYIALNMICQLEAE